MRLLPRILEQNIPGQTVIIGACEVTPSHNRQDLTFPFTQGIPEAREGIGALSDRGSPKHMESQVRKSRRRKNLPSQNHIRKGDSLAARVVARVYGHENLPVCSTTTKVHRVTQSWKTIAH